jgi:hypothetical protein
MHLLWLRLQQKPEQIKEHDKVITKDAISDEGLFYRTSRRQEVLLKIPNNLLDKDMLFSESMFGLLSLI